MVKFLSGDPFFVYFWYAAAFDHITLQTMQSMIRVLVSLAHAMAKIWGMNVKNCFTLARRISRYRFQVKTRSQRSAARLHHEYKPPPDHIAVRSARRQDAL